MKFKKTVTITLGLFYLTSCGPDCSKEKDSNAYESGFEEGKTISSLNSTLDSNIKSCEEWYEQLGKSTPNDCFCAGFNDGLKGNNKRY